MVQTFQFVPVGSLLFVPTITWVIAGLGVLLMLGLGTFGLRMGSKKVALAT